MKKSRKNHVFCALGALSLVATAAQSGEREGHGGVSIVCRRLDHSISSVELLDVFEGNNQYDLTIGSSALPVDDQIEAAQTRLASRPEVLTEFQNELSIIHAHIHFLKEGVGLNPTDDAFPVINKKGCQYEQLAVYAEDGQVLVDADLYGHLDKTNQAALYVHETIFKMARTRGATSSVESRKLTAYLFTRPSQSTVVQELLASMFAPPLPPAPTWPAAFNAIAMGPYRTETADLCTFRIYKDWDHGTMTLEWTSGIKGCGQAGQFVQLTCDSWKCESEMEMSDYYRCPDGPAGTYKDFVRLVPGVNGNVEYWVGAYTGGTFCYRSKALYHF